MKRLLVWTAQLVWAYLQLIGLLLLYMAAFFVLLSLPQVLAAFVLWAGQNGL